MDALADHHIQIAMYRSGRGPEVAAEVAAPIQSLNGGTIVDKHCQITLVYLIPTYGLFFS